MYCQKLEMHSVLPEARIKQIPFGDQTNRKGDIKSRGMEIPLGKAEFTLEDHSYMPNYCPFLC